MRLKLPPLFSVTISQQYRDYTLASAHERHTYVQENAVLYADKEKSKVLSCFRSSNCCKYTLFALDLMRVYIKFQTIVKQKLLIIKNFGTMCINHLWLQIKAPMTNKKVQSLEQCSQLQLLKASSHRFELSYILYQNENLSQGRRAYYFSFYIR